jgi:probable HAF family extracellular repeat protein
LNITYTTLDDPLANGLTFAQGINNAGQVVGWYQDSGGNDHSFLYTNGSYITFDDPLATTGTFAQGINANGKIVGYYQNSGGTHGFLYTGGSFTPLDDPLAIEMDEEYEIAWIWEPIVQLGQAERYIEWVWEGKRNDQLPVGTWELTTQPHMPPRKHLYRIFVDGSLYRTFCKEVSDFPTLRKRLEEVVQAQRFT